MLLEQAGPSGPGGVCDHDVHLVGAVPRLGVHLVGWVGLRPGVVRVGLVTGRVAPGGGTCSCVPARFPLPAASAGRGRALVAIGQLPLLHALCAGSPEQAAGALPRRLQGHGGRGGGWPLIVVCGPGRPMVAAADGGGS